MLIEKTRPFAERERRPLALAGMPGVHPEAVHIRTARYPTHEARHYELAGLSPGDMPDGTEAHVQLNHGDPAGDESRLAAIAKDVLTAEDEIDGIREIGDDRDL